MKEQEVYNHKKPRKLLDQVRDVMRLKHYAFRTELTYISWIKRFILFHGKRHPEDMGEPEVEAFLTWLAVERNVAKSKENLGDVREIVTFDMSTMSILKGSVFKCPYFTGVPYFSLRYGLFFWKY
jgi:hypothetical protein